MATADMQPADALHGDALLKELREDRSKLPNATIMALVMGGLKVRLTRSLVTMGSIVLAIAFLTYTGLANELYNRLAQAVVTLEAAGVGAESAPTAEESAQAAELRRMLRSAGVNIDATLAGDPMDTWLIIMAMLTCTVGIANAMLMSVTERFREIATMKCLGALDALVVKLFLLESSALGVVGAIIGIAVGVLVAILAALGQFGLAGLVHFPVGVGLVVIGLSVVAGIVLSVVGAVYPALMAARMRPVDALRVDE